MTPTVRAARRAPPELPINSVVRRAAQRRARPVLRRAPRGMTLLEMMIVLAILALVMGVLIGPRIIDYFRKSRTDIAQIAVNKLADEAYPAWAATHPGALCPDKLEDLAPFMNHKATIDPWGNPYKMYCGSNLPPSAHGLAITSAGEDGKQGTDDDIKSWE